MAERGSKAPMEMDRAKAEDEFSWYNAMYEFSQSTTLSGVNKITEDTPFKLRR